MFHDISAEIDYSELLHADIFVRECEHRETSFRAERAVLRGRPCWVFEQKFDVTLYQYLYYLWGWLLPHECEALSPWWYICWSWIRLAKQWQWQPRQPHWSAKAIINRDTTKEMEKKGADSSSFVNFRYGIPDCEPDLAQINLWPYSKARWWNFSAESLSLSHSVIWGLELLNTGVALVKIWHTL